jgi:hypothetical protein
MQVQKSIDVRRRRSAAARALGIGAGLGALLLTAPLCAAPQAQEPGYGDFRGAIRSAGFACAHVTGATAVAGGGGNTAKPAGTGTWAVQCNSGTFYVGRDKGGALHACENLPCPATR